MSVDVVVIVDDDDDLQVNYNSGERCKIKRKKNDLQKLHAMLRDDSNLTASSLCRVRFLAWEQRDPRHDMFVVERWEIKKVRFEP